MAREASCGNEEEVRGGARARALWRRLRDTHHLKRRLHLGANSIRRAAKRIYTEAAIFSDAHGNRSRPGCEG